MICGNCQQSTSRIVIKEGKERCEHCENGGLHLEPAWKRDRPTPLYESRPWLYKKTTGPDGETIYLPTEENTAALEAQITKQSAEDIAALAKRRNRVVTEIDAGKAEDVATKFLQHYKETTEEYERANAEYWNSAADDYKVQ